MVDAPVIARAQAILAREDVTIEIPKYSLNHAKENH